MLVYGPSREVARAFRTSTVMKTVNGVMPNPPNVLAYLRQYLNTSGFPQVFLGLPPPIGEPVDLPPNGQSNRAINAADQSTVRIVAIGCGGTQLGSGWVASDGYIVTNAHVVAGSGSLTVQDSTGDHEGTVVMFDPETDVAVVLTETLEAPPLRLVTDPLERGTGGATLGYPGGGGLQAHRAAVQGSYTATGADIYGRAGVRRDIYELRSPVRQGDSGGPFVLPNGTVAGMVFAASTTDPGTGYALTGEEVADEVDAGLRRAEGVATGSCTR
jgi:S1-C subfamily serine protease